MGNPLSERDGTGRHERLKISWLIAVWVRFPSFAPTLWRIFMYVYVKPPAHYSNAKRKEWFKRSIGMIPSGWKSRGARIPVSMLPVLYSNLKVRWSHQRSLLANKAGESDGRTESL